MTMRVCPQNAKGDIVKTSTYDVMGNRTGFTVKRNGTAILTNTYTYDSTGKMLSATSNGKTVNYSYDANGNLLTETGTGHSVTNTYNKANLPVTKVNKKNGTIINNYSMSYDLAGNKTQIEDLLSEYKQTYYYDGAQRLHLGYTEHIRGGDTESSQQYGYDNLGNRWWGYKQLTNNDAHVFDYEYYYGSYNQLDYVTVNDIYDEPIDYSLYYTYDSNGNLASKTKTNSSEEVLESSTYTFNNGGRMTQSTKDGVVTTYTYDGDGLRMSKTTNGVTTLFILDGADVVAEIKGSEITVYSRGLSLFAQTKGATTKTYFSNDHGDVTGLFSSATDGEEALYDGFGITVFNDSEDNPFGYCGEYYDEETGLIYLRARYYDPEIGRFISEDPIMDGTNWYVYCSNNPVMFIDPWGLWEDEDEKYPEFIQKAIKKYTKDWEYADWVGDEIGRAIAHDNAESARILGDSYVNREEWGAVGDDNKFGTDSKHTIVIHHTVGNKTIRVIEKEHIHEGYGTVGYHFVISTDGYVYEGTPLNSKGAHVAMYNTGLLGISLVGNFEPSLFRDNTPSDAQLTSMFRLIKVLQDGGSVSTDSVKGHRDYNGVVEGTKDTVCPGQNLYDIITKYY